MGRCNKNTGGLPLEFSSLKWDVVGWIFSIAVVLILAGMVLQNAEFCFGDDQDLLRCFIKRKMPEFVLSKGMGRFTLMEYMVQYLQSLDTSHKALRFSQIKDFKNVLPADIVISFGELRKHPQKFAELQRWGECIDEKYGVAFYRKKRPLKLPIAAENLAKSKGIFYCDNGSNSTSGIWMFPRTAFVCKIDPEGKPVDLSFTYEIIPSNYRKKITKKIKCFVNKTVADEWRISNYGQYTRTISIPPHLITEADCLLELRFECVTEQSDYTDQEIPERFRGIHLQKIKLEKSEISVSPQSRGAASTCENLPWISVRDGLPHVKAEEAEKSIYLTYLGPYNYKGKKNFRETGHLLGKCFFKIYFGKSQTGGALEISASPDMSGYGNYPGFLIIDTMQNDLDNTPEQIEKALQFARNVIPAHRDAVLLYSPSKNFPGDMDSPSYRAIRAVYEKFADKNGFPSLDLAGCLYAEIRAGRLSLEDCRDPKKFSSIRTKYIDKWLSCLLRDSLSHPLNEAQSKKIIDKRRALIGGEGRIQRALYESGSYPEGWLPWQFSPDYEIPHVLVGTGKNSYSYSFKGSAVGLVYLQNQECGDFLVSIDRSPWRKISNGPAAGVVSHELLLWADLDKNQEHLLQIKLTDPSKKFILGYFLIANYQNPVSLSTLPGIDAVYAKIPPLKFNPEQKTVKELPKTRAKLLAGKPLSVLLLGDSIVNGIFSSRFELLLQEMYPPCKISVSRSVRGSTGCWYYQQPEQFQKYVGSKNFDLLIIGGISHRNDIEAIRKVISMSQKTHPDAEILLMTDAWGFRRKMNPLDSQFDRPPTAQDNTYQGKLLKLRNEYPTGVTFMDITTPWAHYLRNCNVPYSVFKGDPVHANEFGNQVLARIIEAYFAPDGYDPYAQWQKRKNKK